MTTLAARLYEHGGQLVLENEELREPTAGEVLVDLAYAGVNPVDRYVAQGMVASDGPLPRTLGGEASGVARGAQVAVSGAGLGFVRDGVWATHAIVPEIAVVPVPEGVSLEQAAVIGVAGVTAYNVVRMAQVTSRDRVLVLGATGGVGLAILSYALSRGATVWAQTSSVGKKQLLLNHGAHNAVVSTGGDLVQAVAGLAPSVVFDPLGGSFTSAAIVAMSPGGRLVIFGTSAGPRGEVELQQLYRKGVTVRGYGGLLLDDEQRRVAMEGALRAVAAGEMTIPVGEVVPLERANDAFDRLSDPAVAGKVVLDVR